MPQTPADQPTQPDEGRVIRNGPFAGKTVGEVRAWYQEAMKRTAALEAKLGPEASGAAVYLFAHLGKLPSARLILGIEAPKAPSPELERAWRARLAAMDLGPADMHLPH